MKRVAASPDELFKKLTFGIKRSRSQRKEKVDGTALRLRLLPDEETDSRDRNANSQESNSFIATEKEPEILRGFANTTSKMLKKRRKASAAKEQVARIRKLNHIFVWGDDIPNPIIHFTDMIDIPQQLVENLKNYGITEPTPIQMQALPVMMQNRNLLCSAPTGSGKTLAFALPIIVNILRQKNISQKREFTCLNSVVLEPTRELAKQTYVQFLKFSQNLPVTCAFLESDEFPKNVNIIVATPNKLVYALEKNQKTLSLDELRLLVVDESDRLFDVTEGDDKCFRNQLARIFQVCIGNSVRCAFFSATFSYAVEEWCKNSLCNVAMICIGARNSAIETVKQELIFAGSEHGKVVALRALFQNGFEAPALVFVQSKLRAKQLLSVIELLTPPVPVALISSEKTETERESAIVKFRKGHIWVLVCTDLMSRGLDLSGVNLVVNFDLPTSIISYIHRIGRTGRAGRRGHAITYFTEDDLSFIRPIATIIEQAGFEVPKYTLTMRKPTRDEKRKLLKHAPKRKIIGPVKEIKREMKKSKKKIKKTKNA